MDNLQFGSGSALLGGGAGDALNEAVARRQTGQAGVTVQQSPASAGFDPATQVPPAPSGTLMPTAAPTGQPAAAPSTAGLPQNSSEAQIILKALDGRLKSISKQEESAHALGGS